MGFDITGLGSIADLAKGIMDRFIPPKATEAERAAVQIEIEKMLQVRESAVLDAQKAIIVSEMQQADEYTKRARPTLVYAGLLFIFLVHVVFPIAAFFAGKNMPNLSLPAEFWWAWTGVCGIWIVGRSAEKRGATGLAGKIAGAITGTGK